MDAAENGLPQEKVHGDEFAVYVTSPPLSPITK
jgi:hypothetical protein